MSTQFIVEIDLRSRGDFNIAGMDRGVRGLGDGLVRVKRDAGGISDAIVGGMNKAAAAVEGVVSSATRIAAHGGMVAFAGGIAAATFGVMGLNKELETTKISLGSIYTAQGVTKDLPGGVDLARSNIVEMRKLAAQLPGEFTDLLNIMTTTSVPALHAGVSEKQHLQLSSKLMAAGVVAKLPLDMVAREAAQLIEGRSGAHNVLGMRLMGLHGASAQAYNKLSSEERMARLNTELDKYSGSIDVFSRSFEGVSSTALDSAKEWLRAATEPAFFRVKDYLVDANTWLSENDALVRSWADYVGSNLVTAMDAGVDLAKEFGGHLIDGARGGIEILKEYGPALKNAASAGMGLGSEILSNPELLAMLALLGGGGKTRALGVAGLAFAGTSQFTDRNAESWWNRPLGAPEDSSDFDFLTMDQRFSLWRQRRDTTDGSMAGVDITGDGPKWRGRAINVGAEESWMDQLFSLRSDRQSESWWLRPMGSDQMDTREQQLSMKGANDLLEPFAVAAERAAGDAEGITSALDDAASAIARKNNDILHDFNAMSKMMGESWTELNWAGVEAAIALNDTALAAFQASYGLARLAGEANAAAVAETAQDTANMLALNMANQALAELNKSEKDKEKKAPKGGGTRIKVEINVTTNREPNRVARLIKDELVRLDRSVQRNVPRYDRAR